ncbi:DUF2232 domain-containing protein [Methylomicrobium sp. Wu6]|uniref:DUF2232 domain-containing protein n=1 Tax=Methylomicrobium sp. Wu6 TaxID=3107928 RepID=UPI002DD66991|nr:DUF2232 domain-containing protein [Methylomicrobium sp. Wu6]MEC4747185.1 DUF2232 domain-containing protein [Methylomicrobium sp. Wu6]
MRILAEYIMRGRTQAIIVASTLALLSLKFPPISVFSSASIALVTLRRGATEGMYILFGAGIATALLGFFVIDNYQFALLYALLLWLPVWVISIILREGRQLSLAVEIAVFIGMLGVAGFYLYVPEPATMWAGLFEQMVQQTTVPIKDIKGWIGEFSHYMTGMFAAGAVFSLLFGLFLGRWWQSLLFNPGGFKQEFLLLNTSRKLAISSLIALLVAFFASGMLSEIAWNMSILLFVLYTVIGTSVLHVVFAQTKMSRYAVPLFYVTLFLVPQVLPPVAVVGLLDAWLDIRKKNSNQTRA